MGFRRSGCGSYSNDMARGPRPSPSISAVEMTGRWRITPRYSRREVEFILREEKVERLDDLLLRRSLIAMRGGSTHELLRELAEISAETLGWSEGRMKRMKSRARKRFCAAGIASICRRRGLAQADRRTARSHHEHAAV